MDNKLREEVSKLIKDSGIVEVPCNTYQFMTDSDIDLEVFKKNINKLFYKDVFGINKKTTEYSTETSWEFLKYFKNDMDQVFQRKLNRKELTGEFIKKYRPYLNLSKIYGGFEKLPLDSRKELFYNSKLHNTCLEIDILKYIGEI